MAHWSYWDSLGLSGDQLKFGFINARLSFNLIAILGTTVRERFLLLGLLRTSLRLSGS